MSRETKAKDIDGITFTITQLPAMRGLKLMHKLAKALGPAVIKVASKGQLSAQELEGFSDAAASAFERFSADDLQAVIKELFETGTMLVGENTVPIMPVFDNELAGKTGTILKAVQFALEVNYSDFLGVLLANVHAATAPTRVAPLASRA